MRTRSQTRLAILALMVLGVLTPSCTGKNTGTLLGAVDSGNIDEVRRHLNEGTDVNKKDEKGQTPLHLSARNGSKKVGEVLVERGAAINAQDHEGQTPLHLAAREGQSAMVDLLLLKKAKVNSRDTQGRTPLHHATFRQGNETPLLLIAGRATVDAKDNKDWTPLYLASLNNLPRMVELLINKGAQVNPTTGPSPLMGATRDGHTEVVKVLLNYKAQVHGSSKASKTPLHVAAEKGYPQIAELLIQHQAEPNRKDKTGHTPLYYATYHDQIQVMRILIEAHADLNETIKEGTLLHLAAQRGSMEASRLLLEHGAKLEIKDSNGHRPLDVAINNRKQGIADMITAEMIQRREVGK